MPHLLRTRAARILAALIAAVGLFASGMAYADHTPYHKVLSGGALVQTKVATDIAGWGSSGNNVWENVTAARVTLGVPSGKVRLMTAHFNAESFCGASAGGWCALRILAKKSGSATVYEFHPKVGSDFAFDAPAADNETWEGNSVQRSLRLSGGTWAVYVQAQVAGSGAMYLDDWHFEVNSHTSS